MGFTRRTRTGPYITPFVQKGKPPLLVCSVVKYAVNVWEAPRESLSRSGRSRVTFPMPASNRDP